jgi:hypothetical protein
MSPSLAGSSLSMGSAWPLLSPAGNREAVLVGGRWGRAIRGACCQRHQPSSGGVKAPTLVMGGEQSLRYHTLINEVIMQCIPGSRMVVIPQATHCMSHRNPMALTRRSCTSWRSSEAGGVDAVGAIVSSRCRALQHSPAGGVFVQQWCPGPKPHRTNSCSRLPPASAMLRLPAAADARR